MGFNDSIKQRFLSLIQSKSEFLFLVKQLDHFVDPVTIFSQVLKLSDGKPCFFFQNTTEGNVAAHTYIGFDCVEKTVLKNGKIEVLTEGESPKFFEADPFKYIGDRIAELALKHDSSLPFFFQGGVMGYFGYDSVRYLEPILNKSSGAFEKISESKDFIDAQFMICKSVVVFVHSEKKMYLLSGDFIKKSAPINGANQDEVFSKLYKNLDETLKILEDQFKQKGKFSADANADPDSHLDLHSDPHSDPDSDAHADVTLSNLGEEEIKVEAFETSVGRSNYYSAVKKIKEHILAGDIFQAVISERFSLQLKVSAPQIFNVLMREKRSAYQFYFSCDGRVILGASPEMLLRVKENEIETHPIAGTRPRSGKDEIQDKKFEKQLRESPKENAEHLMLVDLARNDIGRISEPGSVKVPEKMQIKKFPGLFHIVSRVTGLLKKGKTPIDALASCFPAGTLSGAPKVRAMQIISETEMNPRGFYGGTVIAASFTGDLDSCIGIRSIEINGERAFIQAGAGIVADSKAENEYEEILTKTKTLRQILAKAYRASGVL
jgi:anthranilate synthase component 1